MADDNAPQVSPTDMLRHLANDNRYLAQAMRELHECCDEIQDVATASLLENYIDEAEGRTWFLVETVDSEDSQRATSSGD